MFGYPPERLDTIGYRRHVWLDALRVIVVKRKLEVVVGTNLIKLIKVREHRFRILRPKDDAAHLTEAHVERLSVERIKPFDVASLQPLHEPVGVERGDVRRAARGDDDRHLGQRLRAVLQLDLLFRPRCHVLIHCIDLLSIFLTHYSLVTAKSYTSISRPYGIRQHPGRGADARDKNGSPLRCGIHLPSPFMPVLYQKHI